MSRDRDTVKKVITFVIENKNVPREFRAELVRQFTEELTDDLIKAGEPNPSVCLQSWTMKHPDLMRKATSRRYSILRVLSDFIMDIDQVAERKAEYPVLNVETEVRREFRYSNNERPLILDEYTSEDDSEVPSGIFEHNFNESNPVEETVFKGEPGTMTASELRQLIEKVKANADTYVKRFANPEMVWNSSKTEWKRTKRRVRATIRKLDVRRVRVCRVCKNGFYSRNGRHICDIVPSRLKKGVSVCEREYEKNYSKFLESSDSA